MNARMMLGLIGVPGQPAVQPYLGRVGLVVMRRVPGSAAVEFCEWFRSPRATTIHHGVPWSTLLQQCLGNR